MIWEPLVRILLAFTILIVSVYARGTPQLEERSTSPCQNGPTTRNCWGEYSVDTDYYSVVPDTGVTREYWLKIQNTTLAPDGYERQMLVVNGTFPGPLIEADWGDNVVIHVTSELENNGTSIHWHGVRMLNTNQYDGVPGVTQCPIAPGSTMTYKFRATQYGSSWYHSHVSFQLVDGVYGPLVIHGPTTADYDEDLGTVILAEWSHKTASRQWEDAWKYSGRIIVSTPPYETGLFNGMNTYNCTGSEDPLCVGSGKRFTLNFEKGKKYLIRLICTEPDGWLKFTLDNHDFMVVASDFVPIVPYRTNNVIMASGQRYDIIVEANQKVGNYWMRAIPQTNPCASPSNENWDDIRGIIRYTGADTRADPISSQWQDITSSCGDESYSDLVPYLALDVDQAVSKTWLNIGWYFQLNAIFHWTLGSKALWLDWEEPTNKVIAEGGTVFPTDYNIREIKTRNQWTYWIIQDTSIINAWHPFHLHGHDFYLLAQGGGLFTPFTQLNFKNPPRRDTASMPGGGYIVIGFPSNNPGSWLFHCHIAWHASQGLSLQFVERESEIPGVIMDDYEEFNRTCQEWSAYSNSAIYSQVDSGI